MNIDLDKRKAEFYRSSSQKVRVLTEDWVNKEAFCPACGYVIKHYENNRPVADFFCSHCKEEYELKSKKDSISSKIVNGAYRTMIERLRSNNNPNLFLLNYSLKNFEVLNFFVIPKYFFVPQIIEKRKPLSQGARRAGWVGCNILLQNVPAAGKIFFVENKLIKPKEEIIKNWRKTIFLSEEKEINNKGWIVDIMGCIDRLNKKEFELKELYAFEGELRTKHTDNFHIRPKIRQQLQLLRDREYLEFLGGGRYRLA